MRAPATLLLCALLLGQGCTSERAGGDAPVIGYLSAGSGAEAARQGLELGLEEARRAAELVGGTLRLEQEQAGRPPRWRKRRGGWCTGAPSPWSRGSTSLAAAP